MCLVEIKGSIGSCLPALPGWKRAWSDHTSSAWTATAGTFLSCFHGRNHICSVFQRSYELQTLAQRLQISRALSHRFPKAEVDGSHERFIVDHNRAFSVRAVCACAMEGAHTWDVMGRGIDAKVF
jgi:bidirectional [NiFe] hydrogenase diaphorase subunit